MPISKQNEVNHVRFSHLNMIIPAVPNQIRLESRAARPRLKMSDSGSGCLRIRAISETRDVECFTQPISRQIQQQNMQKRLSGYICQHRVLPAMGAL